MPYTSSFTANTQRASITAKSYTFQISIEESAAVAGCPTTDLLVSQVVGGTQRRVRGGMPYLFSSGPNAPFIPGQVVGDVATVAGTTTLIQDEL